MHEPGEPLAATVVHGHLEGVDHQVRPQRLRCLPAHDHAGEHADDGSRSVTKGDLVTIQAEDVMRSRVFEQDDEAPDREETH